MSNMNEKELFKLAEIRVSNVDKKIYPDKALVKLCNYMDVYNNDYINSKLAYSIGSADANELLRFGLKKNDVIITKDSETPDDIAISSIVTEDIVNLVCGYHLAIIRPNSDELDGMFLMFKLKDNEIVRYFSNAAKGSTRFGLSIGDIENVKLKYPSVPEQRHIAHILSTCDAVIEKTQSAIVKYKAIKQGLLHDLFTRGIDLQTSKLRPRYEDAPELYKESKLGWIPREWEEKIIDDVAKVNGRVGWKGYTVADLREFGPLALGATHIDKENKLDLSNPIHLSMEKYLESPEIMVQYGDLLIVQRGTIGKVVVINKQIGEATLNPSMVLLNNIKTNNFYLYYQLCSFIGQLQIELLTTQTGVPMISQEQIKNINIVIPENPQETVAIAERLRNIDAMLENEQTYLQKMQSIKKGLMEDLLSGRKRVRIEN
jgi:type I restriction enzyme S subunit